MSDTTASFFYQGNHTEVVRRTIDSVSGEYTVDEVPFIVGALSFLGRIEEAETFYRLQKGSLSQTGKVQCRFFLGVGFCRVSQYAVARNLFSKNLKDCRHTKCAKYRYYAYQGLGFYRYFSGQYRRSLWAAKRSFANALEGKYLYGRAFAADLKGHALIQTGQIALGLKTLELARNLANELGACWLKDAVEVSLLAYRSRFGVSPGSIVKEIEKKLSKLTKQDMYSQSSLLLELATGQILRGDIISAKKSLNECSQIVYGMQNRRHEVLLNLQYAYLQEQLGETHQALILVKTTLKRLDPRVDRALELKLKGMEQKLVEKLQLVESRDQLRKENETLCDSVGEVVGLRMRRRELSPSSDTHTLGEDRLGDLIDLVVRKGKGAVGDVIQSGYFGLLYRVTSVEPQQKMLYFDLYPESLIVFDKGNVSFLSEGVSTSIRSLVRVLSQGVISKSELIKEMWGYDYHPLRHDPLIYSAIAKLRKLLGERGYWVEVSEMGYRLRPEIEVKFEVTDVVRVAKAQKSQEPSTQDIRLNHRQNQILEYLQSERYIDTATCKKLFFTSDVTATRDLAKLTQLGLISKIGKARATKYTRNI